MAEGPLDGVEDAAEGGRVRGGGEGAEEGGAFLGREVQLARRVVGDVGGDDAGEFGAEGLDGDWVVLSC